MDRTDHEWGVRLILKPLSTPQHKTMSMQADIHKTMKVKGKKVYVTFRGTAGNPLPYADARTWHAAYSSLLAEADSVADELTPKKKAAKKTAKKKTVKKAAKKKR